MCDVTSNSVTEGELLVLVHPRVSRQWLFLARLAGDCLVSDQVKDTICRGWQAVEGRLCQFADQGRGIVALISY
jgi:hypothetical protein